MESLANLLNVENVVHPLIAIAYTKKDIPYQNRGTVLGRTMAIHVTRSEPLNVSSLAKFIRHEVFHYFHRESSFEMARQPQATWMYEGAADYFADYLTSTHDQVDLPLMQSKFEKCISVLGDERLAGIAGQAPYACGDFLHRTADNLMENGQDSVWIWKSMLDPVGKHGTNWSPSEFINLAESAGATKFQEIVDLVVTQQGFDRWKTISDILNEAGVRVSFSERNLLTLLLSTC